MYFTHQQQKAGFECCRIEESVLFKLVGKKRRFWGARVAWRPSDLQRSRSSTAPQRANPGRLRNAGASGRGWGLQGASHTVPSGILSGTTEKKSL